METGPDVAPSEEAEREQLCTLLANVGASIAALTPVAAGEEDLCQILQAKQEKRKRVQAQLSALRPLKTRLRSAHEAHEKANKRYKALVEEEESVIGQEGARSSSPMSPAQWAAGLQNALPVQIQAEMLSPSRSPQ